jgi:hypothetical protein
MFMKSYIFGRGEVAVAIAEAPDTGHFFVILEDNKHGKMPGERVGTIEELPENCTLLFFPTLQQAVKVGNAICGFDVFNHLLESVESNID